MTITWNYGCEDAFRTVSSIAKYNAGAWKSAKQRSFAMSKILPTADVSFPRDAENAKLFGITLQENQKGLILDGAMRWADYGRKSSRRVGWFFVIDEIGVVAKYKLRYGYDDSTGSSWVKEDKTELEFMREADVAGPVELPPEERPVTNYFGQVGQRYTVNLKQIAQIDKGYGSFGHEWLTIWQDEAGNKFYYNNLVYTVSREEAEEGIECVFGVKKHIETKNGDKATVISRVMLSKNQKLMLVLKG